jgi:sulfur-oxidizing protein SoxY
MQEEIMFAQAVSRYCATGFRCWPAVLALAVALQFTLAQRSVAQAPTSEEIWNELANQIFKGRPLADGTGLVGIEMPTRAEDAAIVPVTMRVMLPLGDPRRVKALTLVIDENPAPVAATFEFGDNAGVSMIATRVRINSYTDVHLVAELTDGKLYVVKTYVKASGGCSAPAAKNADEAHASLGQMRFRTFGNPPTDGGASLAREAQVMIRHPNNSGLQRDQVTLLYIPAHFIEELIVRQGDALLFRMTGGISISEDPNFRFSYLATGAATFSVEAKDNAGKMFRNEWPGKPGL